MAAPASITEVDEHLTDLAEKRRAAQKRGDPHEIWLATRVLDLWLDSRCSLMRLHAATTATMQPR